MATPTRVLNASGGPDVPARPLAVSNARTTRRIVLDRLASRVVVVGGLVIIASILAILFVIVGEVWPLFKKPGIELVGRHAAASSATASLRGPSLGVDEYREVAYRMTDAGTLEFTSLKGSAVPDPVRIGALDGAHVTAVAPVGRDRYVVGTSDGRARPVAVKFDVVFDGGRRTVTPSATVGEPMVLDPERARAVLRLAAAAPDSGPVAVAQLDRAELALQTVVETKALIGAPRREVSLQTLRLELDGGDVTALRLDGRGDDLFVGTSLGRVIRYDLRERAEPRAVETVVAGRAPVTVLDFLIGDRSLVIGDRDGRVSTWQVVPPPSGGPARLTRLHDFEPHRAAVVAISHSNRDKGFVTTDAGGEVKLRYGTSGKTLATFTSPDGPLTSLVFAPKADGVLGSDERGGLVHWAVYSSHPEITLTTLFGRVWYEGYSRPEYVWQSTGGTDDFESKLSLTPLLYGTLKGTFYALLIAVPLALLAALYVSEFMHPTVKGYVKPVVEIMAALPSVVLGFLAGLWLAPLVERIVPGLVVLPLVLTVCVLGALLLWSGVPSAIRRRLKPGTEIVLLIPAVAAAIWISLALGGVVEARLLAGDYRAWLLSALDLAYDQRNSLVVGLAMGFAVLPIIFTIAEDSLANVPQHLRAGSLALGATRWQTAVRIVLPTASPGIFSAIMIGFGRAVGETMIVLMATGNTPIMDWNIFSGFRALSANIAVELPEAPEGGTLFRVLFLAAFLLFCLTFIVNTAAEMVRLRLRRKYRYL